MELTTKQAEGLKIAVQRFKDRQPWTCIAGQLVMRFDKNLGHIQQKYNRYFS